MGDVTRLPGTAYVPVEDDRVEAEQCLRAALDAGLKDVAIVGRTIGGEIEVWGSSPDADQAIGLLHRGIRYLSDGIQVGLK